MRLEKWYVSTVRVGGTLIEVKGDSPHTLRNNLYDAKHDVEEAITRVEAHIRAAERRAERA